MSRRAETPAESAPPAPVLSGDLEYEALALALAAGLARLWRARHRARHGQGEPLVSAAPPARTSPAA
jgi:hypothetical protein